MAESVDRSQGAGKGRECSMARSWVWRTLALALLLAIIAVAPAANRRARPVDLEETWRYFGRRYADYLPFAEFLETIDDGTDSWPSPLEFSVIETRWFPGGELRAIRVRDRRTDRLGIYRLLPGGGISWSVRRADGERVDISLSPEDLERRLYRSIRFNSPSADPPPAARSTGPAGAPAPSPAPAGR